MLPKADGITSEQVTDGPMCKTCGLQAVGSNGLRADWKKQLTAPTNCPECMERSKEKWAKFGAELARKMCESFWREFGNGDW